MQNIITSLVVQNENLFWGCFFAIKGECADWDQHLSQLSQHTKNAGNSKLKQKKFGRACFT